MSCVGLVKGNTAGRLHSTSKGCGSEFKDTEQESRFWNQNGLIFLSYSLMTFVKLLALLSLSLHIHGLDKTLLPRPKVYWENQST